jgi:hypothetical protein
VGFLLFLTPSALSATFSAYHAVANGRDTPDSGRCRSDFWRPLDGENAPQAAIDANGSTKPLMAPDEAYGERDSGPLAFFQASMPP